MTTTQTTIKKLPPIKEDVGAMKMRIQDLEKEVASYKSRLEELRKAKNNLIIKKTTEYVKQSAPAIGAPREHRNSDGQIQVDQAEWQQLQQQQQQWQQQSSSGDGSAHAAELEKLVENLSAELSEARNLIAALRLENEDAKNLIEKQKQEFQQELATVYAKHEETKREVKQWEVMYKEWMTMMEDRVTNINRTHQLLQQCITQQEVNEDDETNQPGAAATAATKPSTSSSKS